jgi:hypothetical protein
VTHQRVRCPVCSRRTALVIGRLARHKQHDEWCNGSGHSTFEATIILAKSMAKRAKGGPSHG